MSPRIPILSAPRVRHLLLGLLFTPLLASAQTVFSEVPGEAPGPVPSNLTLATGGLGVGALGFLAGAYLGSRGQEKSDYNTDELVWVFSVGSAGGGLTLPLGVHSANDNRGNLPLVTLTSLCTGAAGWAAVLATDEPLLFLAVPVAQVAACIAVERATARSRSDTAPVPPAAPIRMGVTPIRAGMGLVVSGRF